MTGYLGATVTVPSAAQVLIVLAIAAGTVAGLCALIWAGWRWRKRRKARQLASEAARRLEWSERLWREFDNPGTTHPATRLPQHGAGAIRYFAARTHSHPFPPPRGFRCPAADCNWPRR